MRKGLGLISAMFALAAGAAEEANAFGRYASSHRGPAPRNPLRGIYSTNKFTPHQGRRECARRRRQIERLQLDFVGGI